MTLSQEQHHSGPQDDRRQASQLQNDQRAYGEGAFGNCMRMRQLKTRHLLLHLTFVVELATAVEHASNRTE